MLKFAKTELDRLTELVATKAISKSDRDKVEAEFETLKAKLERQRADIVVAERQVDEWKQQLDDTIIRADVGESFINRVKEGQPVVATLDAYPDWKIPCNGL